MDSSRQEAGKGSAPGPAEGVRPASPLHLWEGVGIEIEYMIVDAESLDVRPEADTLFLRARERSGEAGEAPGDVEVAGVEWSNEVALHVLELKTPGPAQSLEPLPDLFQGSLDRAHELLGQMGLRLLPGGSHPWMDPEAEFRIWPHEYSTVYETFDRIFSCRGHGWANVQSTHINLPFAGDEEFARLHEAVRWVLPLIPALSASSPVLDGIAGPALDRRLEAVRENQRRIPSITGHVVPERVLGEADYREEILEAIYRDLAPHDPDGVLRHEWVNSRGAIARFGRGSVEIRVLDAQECPRMDLAVAAAVVAAVRGAAATVGETAAMGKRDAMGELGTVSLAAQLDRTVRRGRRAAFEVGLADAYREVLRLPSTPGDVGELWNLFLEGSLAAHPVWSEPLTLLLEEGSLAERIVADVGLEPDSLPPGGAPVSPDRLRATYGRLADSLARGLPFRTAGGETDDG